MTSLASELFDLSKNKKEYFLKNVDGPVRVEIPILKDIKKKTPLDKCLDVKKLESKDQKKVSQQKEKTTASRTLDVLKKKDSDKENARNIMLAGLIFE